MKRKRKSIYILLILTVTLIGIGYAVITQSLNGNVRLGYDIGRMFIFMDNWMVLEQPDDFSFGITDSNSTITTNLSCLTENQQVKMRIIIRNVGTLDAMVDSLIINDEAKDYVDYSIVYDDDSEVEQYDSLKMGTKSTVILTLKRKKLTKETLPENSIEIPVEISLNYVYAEKKKVKYTGHDYVEYFYTGSEETYRAEQDGRYKLEVWGAQGGTALRAGTLSEPARGGYGSYSVGEYIIKKDDKFYIRVGGRGADGKINVNNIAGGYNGGGVGHWDKNDDEASGGGGGATHIALETGALTAFKSNKSKLLLVAGGGGGGSWLCPGGDAGGYEGKKGINTSSRKGGAGGTQITGYAFGQGGPGGDHTGTPGAGGGGGLWGGYGGPTSTNPNSDGTPGGGGSGWVRSVNYGSGAMYCYQCNENSEDPASEAVYTRTYSTDEVSDYAIPKTPKIGAGYARISYIGG